MARAGNSLPARRIACTTLAALLLLTFVSAATYAQTPAQTPQNDSQPIAQLKVETNLVVVRVVVRDAHGQPVEGLKKEDFKLQDKGKEQSISQFEAISSGQPSSQVSSASGEPSSAPATGPSSQRYLALYFDTLNSTEADIIQAREAADSFLTHSLKPTDRVAIFTTEGMLTDFTADAGKIHTALTALRRSPTAAQRVGQCPQISPYQAIEILETNDTLRDPAWVLALHQANECIAATSIHPETDEILIRKVRTLAQEVASSAAMQAGANLQTLDAITKYVAQAPGQRTVILVSPGFLSESEQNQLDRVIDHALRSQVVINSLDPKGLANLMRGLDASRHDAAIANVRANNAIRSLDSAQQFVASDVLAELAQGTGGQFFHNDNDLKAGFDALAGHPAEYVLAYTPKDLKRDGKYHEIKVTLAEKHKGATILARRGYFAMSAQQDVSIATASRPDVRSTAPSQQPAAVSPQQQTGQSQRPAAPSSSKKRETQPARLFSAFKTKKTTIEQLEQILATTQSQPDAQTAAQIKSLELTERLTTLKLIRLRKTLPGPESQAALLALGDQSAFLAVPSSEISQDAALSTEAQQKLLAQASDYVQKTIARLPNLFATRQSALFLDKPARHSNIDFEQGEPLHYVRTTADTVVYRNGKEKTDSGNPDTPHSTSGKSRRAEPEKPEGDLASSGQFGPLLAKVLADASQSKLEWSYWQKSSNGNIAVFHYSVPRKNSHYSVQISSAMYPGFAANPIKERPGYHGEIAIDPADGTVMRLSILADLDPSGPMTTADLAVEYGSVELGGQSYTCPLHSVVMVLGYSDMRGVARGRTMEDFAEQDSTSEQQARERLAGSPQTMLSDIVFRDYHLFRSEAHILPGSTPVADSKSP